MVWYHGTSVVRAKDIYKCGFFREGTFFARHLEDAVEFGGSYVFRVRVNFKSTKWQVCSLNRISIDKIEQIYRVRKEKSGRDIHLIRVQKEGRTP